MDFRYTKEQDAFREEFTSWLKQNLPEDHDRLEPMKFESEEEWAQAYRQFQKKLYEAGYAAMHYPKEYGGQGRSVMEGVIVLQTLSYMCGKIVRPGGITHGMAVPTIYLRGTEEQKKTYLPKIFDGTHIWCQGFSEPNAGSDVVNVSTRAVRDGDHYVVNGQKVWTSFAHMADYGIMLVLTDSNVQKHKGLSYMLIDMKAPGVEVRPIRQMTGEAEFNEVFFEDVKVPVDMRVGEEGEGWMIAITTLMFERVIGDASMAAGYMRNIDRLMEMANQTKRAGKPVSEDPIFRQQLAEAYIDVMVLKYHGLRNLSNQTEGAMPGPEGSIGKILWSEPNQKITEAAINMQGPNGQIMEGDPLAIQDGFWQYSFLRSKGNTIEAGTSEIQRNIIGERVLGLPKDTSRAERQK